MAELDSPQLVALHLEMTEDLRRAIRQGGNHVEQLCEAWEEVHEARKQERRRLTTAIRKAEAHFKLDEAEKLRQELAALG